MFSKLNFHVPEETVRRIVLCTAGMIEPMLSALREKILSKQEHTRNDTGGSNVCMVTYVTIHPVSDLLSNVFLALCVKYLTTFCF